MKFASMLSVKNLKRKPARSLALILIAAFLTLSVFAGSVIIASLQNGLNSYEARLGADIIVAPFGAGSQSTFESILVQGVPKTFYMEEADYEKIRNTEGVEVAAPEFYLASTSAGCCSVSVQIIGFDPALDFTVQPWVNAKYDGDLAPGDVIVGSQLTAKVGEPLKFFDTSCKVVAKLDETGTGLDTAVYTSMDTIRLMVANARTLGFDFANKIDPDTTVSSVMIKVADGYTVESVLNDINIHVRHVEAGQSASMLSGISTGLMNVSGIIRILTVMIWILAIAILSIAFLMIAHERAREFAVLRVMGASRRMVSRVLLTESAIISGIGAVCGLLVSLLIILPFDNLIRMKLALPYLLPDASRIILLAVISMLVSVAAGALTSAVSAYRVSRQDTALALKEGT